MIKLVSIELNRGAAYKKAKAHLDKVGLKSGYFTWYVDAKKLPMRLLKPIMTYVTIIPLDGRITMNSIKRVQEKYNVPSH